MNFDIHYNKYSIKFKNEIIYKKMSLTILIYLTLHISILADKSKTIGLSKILKTHCTTCHVAADIATFNK
jgi:hypothetical protein